MPPRYAYWTILAGGLPTAFRAAEKDELLPTFKRIQEKQPDAQMKFFARGKLWDTPEQALRAEAGPRGRGPEHSEPRNRDWRPGGDHRDPRQPFKDAKKARNQDRRQERWDRKNQQPAPGDRPGRPDRDRPDRPYRERPDRPYRERPERPDREQRFDRRPPREKPHGDPMREEIRARGRDFDRRGPAGPKSRGYQGKGQHGVGGKREQWGRGDSNRGDRPPGGSFDRWAPREKPHGDKLGGFERRNRGSFENRDRDRRPSEFRPDRPRTRPHGDKFGGRPFRPQSERNQEGPQPPRPKGPNREPRPGQEPPPEPPPRPSEATIPPPGPPERGGGESNKGGKLIRKKR